jgi:dTDP-4-amino-4,6-dideoxygalactose transaminase
MAMIPVTQPLVGEDEAEAARAVLLSGWLAQGPEVEAFEREFAGFVGAPHACAVSNCSVGLGLALQAMGVGPDDEVITVSLSFIAGANYIRAAGAEPVFVDVTPTTFNLDPAELEGAITARTKAILCAHQIGMPCDLGAILAIARAHGIPVIEDAACAAGSEILIDGNWQRIGRPHGDIACFSFHPTKIMTTGEGGMLTTKNAEYDRMFRRWRQHGMDVPADVRHNAKGVIFERYAVQGYNYRMTDLQGAIGRRQLTRLPHIVKRRRDLAARYRELLADLAGLGLPPEPNWARSNWQRFCVRLPDRLDQRAAMQALRDRGIATSRGVMCAHLEPPYAKSVHRPLPWSEAGQGRCLLIPLYPQMSDEEQDRVAAALRDVCRE